MTAYNKPKETEFLTLIVRKQKQERQKVLERVKRLRKRLTESKKSVW